MIVAKLILGVIAGVVVGVVFVKSINASTETNMKIASEALMRKRGYLNEEFKSELGGWKDIFVAILPPMCALSMVAIHFFLGVIPALVFLASFTVFIGTRDVVEIKQGIVKRVEDYNRYLFDWSVQHKICEVKADSRCSSLDNPYKERQWTSPLNQAGLLHDLQAQKAKKYRCCTAQRRDYNRRRV